MKNMFSGLKLGLLLQVGGIGPICLLLFQLPSVISVKSAFYGLAGVVLADAVYIFMAAVGISPLIQKIEKSQRFFRLITGVFLIGLGAFFILSAFKEQTFFEIAEWIGKNTFSSLFTLTLLNPMTIVVFVGIFTVQIVEKKLSKTELLIFAFGVLLATPVFLGTVIFAGALCHEFLPESVIDGLNIVIGLFIVFWGGRQIFDKIQKTKQ